MASATLIRSAFDHLVIGAETLAAGGGWALETLKRDVPLGGAHPNMGTHNRLARFPDLGGSTPERSEAGYLEIIAVDPSAAAPARPRWYGLDAPEVQARLRRRPRPLSFVLAVRRLEEAAAQAAAAGWDIGETLEASRGDLSWRIAVPRDGRPVDGVLPAVIEWPAALCHRPPVARMPDLGLSLRELRLFAEDPSDISARLAALDAREALARAGVALTVVPAGASTDRDADTGPRIEAMFSAPRVQISA